MRNKRERFLNRKKRIRAKIFGSEKRPRISVFKSNRSIYVQAIDDEKGITLAQIKLADLGKISSLGLSGMDIPKEIGKKLGEKLIAKKIKEAVFDKGGYKYHGKIKAVAEGLREVGIKI